MINNEKAVRKALLEIELKHYDYFKENKKSIVNYITIHWGEPLYISISDNRLPLEISLDLEEFFSFLD